MARGAELERIAHLLVLLATGGIRERLADLLLLGGPVGRAHGRQHGSAQEPGSEGTVEEIELVLPRRRASAGA